MVTGEGNQTSLSVAPNQELDKIEEEYKNLNEEEMLEKTSDAAIDGSDKEPENSMTEEEKKEQKEKEKQEKARRRIHPVEGYPDNVNMFEKLINVEKIQNQPAVPHKHTNNRHRYSITVQDRIFKIKKNPSYIKKKKEKDLFDQKEANLAKNVLSEKKEGSNEEAIAEAQEVVQNELIKQDELRKQNSKRKEN